MKIVFLDRTQIDYNVRTPHERAVGGTQSGICYLSAALARRGHDVTMATHTTAPGRYDGVNCVGRTPGFTVEYLQAFDVVVIVNGAFGARVRKAMPKTRLVLWTHHAHDQPEIANLANPDEAAAWDAIVTLSEWQTARYAEVFPVPRLKYRIQRNGIAPAFERGPWPTRRAFPVFAYTSTPFRGLRYLLDGWPTIRAAMPGAVLRVYSSMAIYGPAAAEKDSHGELYQRCRTTPGVEYVGNVPQQALAAAMAETDALLYPSTFAETSCISVLEALAAGCRVYTTRTAALPETGAPYARMIELGDRATLARRFAERVVADPPARDAVAMEKSREQALHLRHSASWDVRAVAWEQFLRDEVPSR